MGRKAFKIRGYIERIYFHIAEDKKFRLYEELINPDIKRVVSAKIGNAIYTNTRFSLNPSKSKI